MDLTIGEDELGRNKRNQSQRAKKVVNALGLKSVSDWQRWSRTERPPDIPSHPSRTYKYAGWNGMADWLGNEKRPEFLPYKEAKKVVNALGLKSQDDWPNKQIYVLQM